MRGWWILVAAVLALTGPAGAAPPEMPARFAWLAYDAAPQPPVPRGLYRNPVLPGFQPDPAMVRVGRDFYLVNSTFAWWPGIPVYHSRDLVNWRLIGHGLNRPAQLNLAGLGRSAGSLPPVSAITAASSVS